MLPNKISITSNNYTGELVEQGLLSTKSVLVELFTKNDTDSRLLLTADLIITITKVKKGISINITRAPSHDYTIECSTRIKDIRTQLEHYLYQELIDGVPLSIKLFSTADRLNSLTDLTSILGSLVRELKNKENVRVRVSDRYDHDVTSYSEIKKIITGMGVTYTFLDYASAHEFYTKYNKKYKGFNLKARFV